MEPARWGCSVSWGWGVLAPAQPHSFDRLICVFLACALLTYAWGVLMALVARRRGWTPRGCSLSGLPLWALGLFALVGDPHIKVILDVGGLALSSDLAGRWRRRLAFPELGWSGKDPEPSLSINPWPPSQPDTFGGRS